MNNRSSPRARDRFILGDSHWGHNIIVARAYSKPPVGFNTFVALSVIAIILNAYWNKSDVLGALKAGLIEDRPFHLGEIGRRTQHVE